MAEHKKFPPSADALSCLMHWLASVLAQANVSAEQGHRIELVVEELATNIITHGLPADARWPLHWIGLEVVTHAAEIEVVVEDTGMAFDPLAGPLPASTGERLGAAGLPLIREMPDAIRYRRVGSCNRVTARFMRG